MSDLKTDLTHPEKEIAEKVETEFDLLCEEAHRNAKKDRTMMRSHLKKLEKHVAVNDVDDATLLLFTEAMTKTSEALSKSNLQIIQIAQLKMKSTKKTSETIAADGFSETETTSLFDEIDENQKSSN